MSGFNINISGLVNGMAKAKVKKHIAIDLYAQSASKKLESHAKENATWIDRTGIARQTITGGHGWDKNKCNIYVAGNTEYFPYLELANEKKNAILKPTVDKYADEIVKGLNNILK